MGTLFGAPVAAAAAPADPSPLKNQCSTDEWRDPSNFKDCTSRLADLTNNEVQCVQAPTPEAPDSGMAGWFASEPDSSKEPGPKGMYSHYGYAGYDYTTYDIGCVKSTMDPQYKFENTLANGEFMIAGGIIGAADALREKAWQPASLWGWADPLVHQATQAIYQKVFTVFGVVTLAVVGLYLLWRSRQSDMSNALTTAGWAIVVMVAVTAIAAWPERSANLADQTLVAGLDVVHGAVGPEDQSVPPDQCVLANQDACVDHRTPATRASDTAVETLLYRNWLRGELGSSDSPTAQKYGPALYDAKSLTWDEADKVRQNPATRDATIAEKQQQWMKVAKQIKTEDPEAYEYLQGSKGWDRVGAGFIAILAALFYSMFDIVASLLVLLGFLIFRWAVIAAPALGTIGMLRPASTGIRRLANAVVAAIFNIIIFGTGSSIYLFAVDVIMNTATIPGWLQVVLVWLCGIVGWLLLRPYRRITQLGGKASADQIVLAGRWHRRFLRDVRDTATRPAGPAEDAPARRAGPLPDPGSTRPETRLEDVSTARPAPPPPETRGGGGTGPARPRTRTAPRWREPEVADEPASYTIYRPDPRPPAGSPAQRPARRPESAPVRN
ncbi:MAG TPA: MFS transporter [Rugosimonospora sp.]|nr:MFS transporter [Rugosimonospora sp.]